MNPVRNSINGAQRLALRLFDHYTFSGFNIIWEEPMPTALEGKSILIVDDDPDMVTALVAILDDSGATIETARDGNAAVEVAGRFNPDLIVLDAMLPKRSGFLVLEKLKGPNKKKGAKPYIIMITGNAGKRHQTWAESLGVDGYLNKPFRMERLTELMEKLFSTPEAPAKK